VGARLTNKMGSHVLREPFRVVQLIHGVSDVQLRPCLPLCYGTQRTNGPKTRRAIDPKVSDAKEFDSDNQTWQWKILENPI